MATIALLCRQHFALSRGTTWADASVMRTNNYVVTSQNPIRKKAQPGGRGIAENAGQELETQK